MKSNFIISVYQKNWIDSVKHVFIAEPYVYHFLKINNGIKDYESIEIAPFIREAKDDLILDHEMVDEKYHKYVPILAKRLNKIHNTNHNELFWKKCLALDLLRYITLFHDVFKVCEINFSEKKHDCNILSKKSYYLPDDFNLHREFFQYTAYGQEQIFSIYINLFYPDKFRNNDDLFEWPPSKNQSKKNNWFYI